MRIFFSRHGESEANVLRIISNKQVPHPLTALGRSQATRLAEKLSKERIKQIYSSTVFRAQETAEIVSTVLGAPISMSDGLREFDCGVMEGRSDGEAWAAHADVIRRWYEVGDRSARIEGGESLQEVEMRFWRFLGEVQDNGCEQDEAILVITHGMLLYSMMPLIFSNISREDIAAYGLDNTCVIEGSSKDGQRRCVQWNDHRFANP